MKVTNWRHVIAYTAVLPPHRMEPSIVFAGLSLYAKYRHLGGQYWEKERSQKWNSTFLTREGETQSDAGACPPAARPPAIRRQDLGQAVPMGDKRGGAGSASGLQTRTEDRQADTLHPFIRSFARSFSERRSCAAAPEYTMSLDSRPLSLSLLVSLGLLLGGARRSRRASRADDPYWTLSCLPTYLS